MTQKDKKYDLIIKNLMDEISDEEQEVLENELNNNLQLRKSFMQIWVFWKNFFPATTSHSIIEKTEAKLGLKYHLGAQSARRAWLRAAAGILLILSLGFSLYSILKPKIQIALNEYGTGPGEIKQVVLSDGTKVWLNSSSLLIASEPFTSSVREVKLFGEAYFEVAPNKDQPFIVQTRELKTRVLGTHFNMVAYPTDEVHEISLHEGKIQLNPDNGTPGTILTPGQRAYFTVNSHKLKVVRTDLGKPAQWRDGILRFYDEDLFSICKKLERQFRTRIFIADSLVGNLRFSAEFEKESLSRILELLNEAQPFDYRMANNGIIIKTKKK